MTRRPAWGLLAGVLVLAGAMAIAAAAPSSIPGPAVANRPAVRLDPPKPAGPRIGDCPVFPADNAWNQDISKAALHPNSSAIIARIQATGSDNLHPDFGENQSYGIPYVVVPANQANVPITYDAYGDESDPGPFPIPLNAPVEGGSDRHVLVVQQGTCRLFELFVGRRNGAGWVAASGARFDLNSNALRPLGWTSADAAGLPILPGLVRADEVAAGAINHAIRVTFSETRNGYILPATHVASSVTRADAPPMGMRLRLKATYDISGLSGQARIIAEAMQRYGLMVADNGSNWYFQGATSTLWNDDDLDQLKAVPGTAFEVVDTGPVITG